MALTAYWAVNQVESPVDVQLRYNIRFASLLMVVKLNIVGGPTNKYFNFRSMLYWTIYQYTFEGVEVMKTMSACQLGFRTEGRELDGIFIYPVNFIIEMNPTKSHTFIKIGRATEPNIHK